MIDYEKVWNKLIKIMDEEVYYVQWSIDDAKAADHKESLARNEGRLMMLTTLRRVAREVEREP